MKNKIQLFNAKQFGPRLKSCREQRGLTQLELGIRVGYPEKTAQQRINNCENGWSEPNLSDINKMAAELGIPPGELAFGANFGIPSVDSMPLIEWSNMSARRGKKESSVESFKVVIPSHEYQSFFNKGDTLVVDPKARPRYGDFVVVHDRKTYDILRVRKAKPLQLKTINGVNAPSNVTIIGVIISRTVMLR